MPTEQEIQHFLSRLQRLSESEESAFDPACPICFEHYAPQDEAVIQQAVALGLECDYPVMVRSFQPNSACRHVFGRACIEQHFRSGGPWCTKCPTCREEWFPDNGPQEGVDFITIPMPPRFLVNREMGYGRYFAPPQEASTVFSMTIDGAANADVGQRVSLEAAGAFLPQADQQTAREQGSQEQQAANRAAARVPQVAPPSLHREDATLPRMSNRHIINNAIVYLHRALLTAEIDGPDEESNQKVDGVKVAVEALWTRLESLSGGRRNDGTASGTQSNGQGAQGPAREQDMGSQRATAIPRSNTAGSPSVITAGRTRILYA